MKIKIDIPCALRIKEHLYAVEYIKIQECNV